MSPKTTPFSWELFSFFKQLAGLFEEHLDLGPTTDRQVLKSTYLHMSLPKISTLVESKGNKFSMSKFSKGNNSKKINDLFLIFTR